MISKYLTEIKYGKLWYPVTVWTGFRNVRSVIDRLPTWIKGRGVDRNNVRVKRLRTTNELLKAQNDILWRSYIDRNTE